IYSRGNAAILRSADRGKTFEWTDVPFKMGGNEMGRNNGERLAVDPNSSDILFFGSRRDGLWKSVDRAVTWEKVPGFPEISTTLPPPPGLTNFTNRPRRFRFQPQAVGIVSVVFDPASGKPGPATPVIYAAVSAPDSNLLYSADAGATWQLVTNRPVGLRPTRLVRSPDGLLYLSYGKEPGPNVMTDGAVWKFDPKKSTWTDITPVKPTDGDQRFGYGAVNIDPQHPNVIMATTFARWNPMDEIFRSTNGGTTWMPLVEKGVWDHSSAPYTRMHKPHWMGDIEISPSNSNHVMFTTGYGIWSCRDITAADAGRPTHWEFFNHGLEETVPQGLISPPEGAHLLSALGDQDGFRHDDLTVSPPGGAFAGPRFSNSDSIAFAAGKPQIIVRAGSGGSEPVHAAISVDGGQSWQALGSEPPDTSGAGNIALSADAKTIVWTPRRGAPYFSTDRGTNWTACLGLQPRQAVVADSINPARFYAFDSSTGRLDTSTNGAVSFLEGAAELPKAEEFPGGFGGGGGVGGEVYATPGREGVLWIAFRHEGLYCSTNAGATFTKLGGVDEAYSLGFGKAAPGRDRPTLYLAGKIGDVQAIFRSDDDGRTWLRLNDDSHQYGWVNHVTGDPRIYGRVHFATGGRGIIYGDPVPVSSPK
ncbi:MAG TPA: cellulase, partial [Verrucomicrobiae bacterium]|nr:cellulase [Verrucomicrobiae bacterium]